MNRSILLVLGAVILAAGSAGGARADDRAEIDALYVKLAQALKNKTPEETLALETPDFKSIDAHGKAISGKALVAQMKQQDSSVKDIKSVDIKVKSYGIKGNTAKAVTDFSYAVEIEDKDGHMGPKGGTHEMAMSGEVKNDLVKTAAGWKFKSMREGTGKVFIDGKPVPQAPPGAKRIRKK